MSMTNVEKARKMSGMSQVAAGRITGMTNITFAQKEKMPGRFTLDQFFALYREMDEDSREIMWGQLVEMRDKNLQSS